MEGISTDDIRATLSKEKVTNNLDTGRVMLACLRRGNGRDGTWIADMLQVSCSITHDWLNSMRHGGPDARYGCRDEPE